MVKIIELPKVFDPRGNLTFIQKHHIEFDIKRVFWTYDVPGGETRGGHAYRQQQEIIIALSGSMDVIVDDGMGEQKYQLNRPYYGLYIGNGIWRHLENFATNTCVLTLASTAYDPTDYIRDKEGYIDFLKSKV